MHKHYHIDIIFRHEWCPIHKCQPRCSQSKPSSSPPSSSNRPASSPTILLALMFVNVAASHLSINICVGIVENSYFLPKTRCRRILETYNVPVRNPLIQFTKFCTICNCNSRVRSDVVIKCYVGKRKPNQMIASAALRVLCWLEFLHHPEGKLTRTLLPCRMQCQSD